MKFLTLPNFCQCSKVYNNAPARDLIDEFPVKQLIKCFDNRTFRIVTLIFSSVVLHSEMVGNAINCNQKTVDHMVKSKGLLPVNK